MGVAILVYLFIAAATAWSTSYVGPKKPCCRYILGFNLAVLLADHNHAENSRINK